MYQFKTKPWEHQIKALDYLTVRNTAALYIDMGSGKTKIGLDLIVNRSFDISLIVTTKKSCTVWIDEIDIHTEKGSILACDLSKYSTKDKDQVLQKVLSNRLKTGSQVVLIINYDSIWRKPFADKLLKIPIDCIICDESHRIKSPHSKCSLFLTKIGKKVPNRYLFTGTPTPERPLDIYAQYRFLDSSIFGTNFTRFRAKYENIDPVKSMYAGYRALDKNKPYKNLEELKKLMYSCAFYAHVDLKLPDTHSINTYFTPSNKAIKAYKRLYKDGIIEKNNTVTDVANALAKVLRLQEILSGYMVYEDESYTHFEKEVLDNARLECLQNIIEDIIFLEKVVVFVKFRHDFNQIEALCKKLCISYGEISGKRDDYKDWKKGKIQLLAVHYKSGSESISLVEARYCIYYSLTHSYGMYAQSKKRVHRPKQTKPVTYYHIIAKIPNMETIDEQIMKALSEKKNLIEYLLGTGKGKNDK